MVTKDYYMRHRGYENKITAQIRNALTSAHSTVVYNANFVRAFKVLKSFLEANKKRLIFIHKVKYNGEEIFQATKAIQRMFLKAYYRVQRKLIFEERDRFELMLKEK